jgi:outer membrane protein insertion porin family
MFNKQLKLSIFLFFIFFLYSKIVFSQVVKDIVINGNDRIPSETILMFSNVKIKDDINENKLNLILKDLYNSNFFEDVSINFENNVLRISVIELPVIENITYNGIKAQKVKDAITKNLKLRSRSSYDKIILIDDNNKIISVLRDLGYYFASIDTFIEEKENNKIDIRYEIDLGEKAKIKKISFIGDKVFKDRKLRNIIISEEYKFWKIISGKKFLNENLIRYDERLLRNYYLNKGFYDVKINPSFAKSLKKDQFELIYNIDANDKIYFGNLSINLPDDFLDENFIKLNQLFVNLEGQEYSINAVEDILNTIDEITLNEEFKTITASVNEEVIENKINIEFIINESEKYFVEKINILGNNITRENVIRNQLEIDEGDPFNEILQKKSVNNLKSLNFFKSVNAEVSDGKKTNSKIINIKVEEKATGQISAGAGIGTSGSTFNFGIRENNYLGKGLMIDTNATINVNSFKGEFSITNPNYKNSDKAVFVKLQAIDIDRTKNYGYKTNKTGLELGTNFEYLRDLNFGLSGRSFYEKITTDSTASKTQQKLEGNYFDTFLNLNLDYDKRNQRFKTSKGFRSFYGVDLPIISNTDTLTNTYSYKFFSELYENNISTISFFAKTANSISGGDIKLSERLSIPGSKLRGFEVGKVGPKDGIDFIGGNHLSTVNITSTLPTILENAQNVDFLVFFDAANLWGVDYDSTIGDGSKIRSSVGVGVDWFTPIGPLNFSLTESLSKSKHDVTESFRFNLGTTF